LTTSLIPPTWSFTLTPTSRGFQTPNQGHRFYRSIHNIYPGFLPSLNLVVTILLNVMINIYHRWLYLWEWTSQSKITSRVKPQMWDTKRSPFLAKYINNIIIIYDLLRWSHWRQYNATLWNIEINDNMLVKIKGEIYKLSINKNNPKQ